MKILLLGGTAEAREVAQALQGREVVYSLAGATDNPAPTGIPSRIGGFGGVAGLAAFLRDGGFTHLIDATHPFAAQMKRHVDLAALETSVGAVHLLRPAWGGILQKVENVSDLASAAAAVPPGARVFLALGSRHLETFRTRSDVGFWVRSITQKTDNAPFTFLVGRPPFSVEEESATLRQHQIDTLVLRDSGGSGGLAKVVAAQRLGMRIIVIDRPPPPSGLVVSSVAEVLQWLGREEAKW